jgi:type IV pilus assembly protein PilW
MQHRRPLPPNAAAPGRAQTGFTLVELMISMVLGIFIVLALVTLLINVNRNNGEMSKTNRVIENGRFALQLLEADVSHAGFLGGYLPSYDDLSNTSAPTDYPTAAPDPCPASWSGSTASTFTTASYVTNLIGIPLQTYQVSSPVPTPTLSVCASRITNPQASTDVLFVRHMENTSCVPGTSGCPANSGMPYLQVGRCFDTASPGYSTTTYVMNTDTTTFTLRQRDCTSLPSPGTSGTQAPIWQYTSNMYYIRNYSVTSGDGIPTLVRSQFGLTAGVLGYQTEQALIEGVDGFRVELGIDNISATGAAVNLTQAVAFPSATRLVTPSNRGDGYPDGTYVHCTTAGTSPCTATDLANTVAAKVFVLIRAPDKTPNYTDSKVYCMSGSCSTPTYTTCPAGGTNASPLLGPFCDGYKRHLFTQTIRLTNVSMRRETPPS